jgi:hypothetical protein
VAWSQRGGAASAGPLAALAAPDAPPPPCAVEASLWHAWHWCGGWRPERLLLYVALHPVPDLPALLEHLPTVPALIEQAHG